jgi:hypothetical protein
MSADDGAGRARANIRRKFEGQQYEDDRKRFRHDDDVDLALGAPPFSRFKLDEDEKIISP